MAWPALPALVVLAIPLKAWEKAAPWIFVAALLLLMLVLIPGIGKVVNFSRRWIPLGVMNFQPSELAKLAIALYAANYMVRKMDVKERFFRAVWPMVVALAFVGVLLLAEPDMGAFIVIATIAMGILFLGGVNGRMFFLITLVLVGTFVLIIAFDDLRRERILAYLDPWNPKYAQGKAYQLTHSLIAFGRGEIFGQGLGSQRGEAALPARGAHRLPAGRDRRGAGLRRRLAVICLLLADAAHLRDRPPGHRAGPRVRRPDGAGHRHVDGRPGLHQHGREPGRAADQGPDAAADELRRLGHPDEPGRAGDGAAGRHGKQRSSCAEAGHDGGDLLPSPGHHGRRHRRAHHPGLAVAREMQSPRLERELAGHRHRHGEPAGAKAGIPLDTHRLQRPARQGLPAAATGGLRLLKASGSAWPSCAGAPPTRCWAWAAMSAFPAA
jgi:hypothetical protein